MPTQPTTITVTEIQVVRSIPPPKKPVPTKSWPTRLLVLALLFFAVFPANWMGDPEPGNNTEYNLAAIKGLASKMALDLPSIELAYKTRADVRPVVNLMVKYAKGARTLSEEQSVKIILKGMEVSMRDGDYDGLHPVFHIVLPNASSGGQMLAFHKLLVRSQKRSRDSGVSFDHALSELIIFSGGNEVTKQGIHEKATKILNESCTGSLRAKLP